MPAPIDLSGRRFGKLLVLRADGKIQFGRLMTAWLCRCDCGAEERIPQERLPYRLSIESVRGRAVTSCSACRNSRVCEECGKAFVSELPRATCSEFCAIAHRRKNYLRHYYKKTATDPDFNRGRYRAAVERMKDAPEKLRAFYDRANAAKRMSVEQRNADPERRRAFLEKQREYYAARAAEIQAARKERLAARLAAMTPEERAEREARLRETSRNWWEARRKQIRAHPDQYQAFRTAMREYRRQREAKKALADLMALSTDLEAKTRK